MSTRYIMGAMFAILGGLRRLPGGLLREPVMQHPRAA